MHAERAGLTPTACVVVRAFQLFSVAALNRDDGSFNITYTNFSYNFAPYSEDGGALFVKESPGRAVKISRSQFVNNSAPLTRGGALNLQAAAIIFECLFEENSANEGGAIYVGTDGTLDSTSSRGAPSRPRRSRPVPATSAAASHLARPLVPTAVRATHARAASWSTSGR